MIARDTSNMEWGQWFDYNEGSPSCLVWKADKGHKIKKGAPAGSLQPSGYYKVGLNGASYRCHRILYEMLCEKLSVHDKIDHIDGDSQNNKISNLRRTDNTGNARNCKLPNTNKSGIVGVSEMHYFQASWIDLSGKPKSKQFSVAQYGRDVAFDLACECRLNSMRHLNTLGAGYSDRHGT